MTRPVVALILAAGLGSRLGALTRKAPKAMLRAGGRSLLERSFDSLRRCGVLQAIVVTGHGGHVLRSAFGSAHAGVRIEYVDSPDYATTGSMVSLLRALRHGVERPLVLLESDIVYHDDLLAAAIVEGEPDRIIVADCSGSGDEVFVVADERGNLQWLGKKPATAQRAASKGELAGITRLSGELLDAFGRSALAHIAAGEGQLHYEDVLLELALAGHPVAVAHRPGLPWSEVDTVADLRRVRNFVWPRLAASYGGER